MLCCNACILNLGFTTPGLVVQEVKDELLPEVIVNEVRDEMLKEESKEEVSTCKLAASPGAEILQWDCILNEVDKGAACESRIENAVKRKKKKISRCRRPNKSTVGGSKSEDWKCVPVAVAGV